MAHATKKTLDRHLSRAGACSRTQAQRAIAEGRVQVNGRVVRNAATWIDPGRDQVRIDGELLKARAKEVWMMHKPVGYVTTADDERDRRTVYDLLPDDATWLAPVGRLDLESSGLLLFTNDSDLANAITAPASKLQKTYVVHCEGLLDGTTIGRLGAGVELDDGPTLPAIVVRTAGDHDSTTLRIELIEGRNRQIRRMLAAVGSQVLTLHRTRIGPLDLGSLGEGACRRLDAAQVATLRRAISEVKAARHRAR